jgi:uncharacterized protein
MFKMPRRLRHAPKILVALIWILPGYFFFFMARVGLLLTWLAVLPDWFAKVTISFVATPGFLILGSILVGLSSLLLWYRLSNRWATIFAILIPFLLLCGGAVFAGTDTQGLQRYVIAAAQRGDLKSTREQLLIQNGLSGTLNYSKTLIQMGADVNARDPDGRSPLYGASYEGGDPEIVKLLLRSGAQPDAGALGQAAAWGRLDAIKLMIEATPDDGKTLVAEGGNQALDANRVHTRTSAEDRAQIAQMLIARGAKSNYQK